MKLEIAPCNVKATQATFNTEPLPRLCGPVQISGPDGDGRYWADIPDEKKRAFRFVCANQGYARPIECEGGTDGE